MKNIAFLSFDWDYKIVSEYYLGLQEFLGHRDDVRVTVFNAFGRYYASHVPVQSFLEIFSLYDPADYDGYDPEIGASTTDANGYVFGLDNGRYPSPFTCTFAALAVTSASFSMIASVVSVK